MWERIKLGHWRKVSAKKRLHNQSHYTFTYFMLHGVDKILYRQSLIKHFEKVKFIAKFHIFFMKEEVNVY